MKSIILFVLLIINVLWGYSQTPVENLEVAKEMSVGRSNNTSMDIQTSLVTYNGSIYFGYVDQSSQGCISKKDKNGNITTKIITTGLLQDPHNGISIGIDAEGYIHCTGDMHQDTMKYWRSDKPDDITSFTAYHGKTEKGGISGLNGVSYGRFIQSRKGTLFYLSRQRLTTSFEGWVPGDMGGNIQVFNTLSKRWEQLGSLNYALKGDKGQVITGGTDSKHLTKCVFWDNSGAGTPPNNGYQGYKIWVVFDKNNRMHMVWNVAKNPARTGDISNTHTHLMYAYSDDEGKTWKKSNGQDLVLPITTESGEIVYYEDPNVDALRMFNAVYVALTSDQQPVIFQWSASRNQTLIFRYSGSQWIEETEIWKVGWPGVGLNDDNGWITALNGNRFFRSNDNGVTLRTYELSDPYKQKGFNSYDIPYMLETGKLRFVFELDGAAEVITYSFQNAGQGQVMPPQISPVSGSSFPGTATVTITCETPEATIRYTLDGSEPTADNGNIYVMPFSLKSDVTENKILKARAFVAGKVSSRITVSQISVNTETDNIPPSAPTGLRASNISENSVSLTWEESTDNSNDKLKYEIYKGNSLIGTSLTSTFNLSGLVSGQEYQFSVRAKDSHNNLSGLSAPVKALTSDPKGKIYRSTNNINIDGMRESAWPNQKFAINKKLYGTVNDSEDLNGNWTAIYDDNFLFFFIEVQDNILNVNAANWYEKDGVEIYIDSKNTKAATYSTTDFQFNIPYGSTLLYERNHNFTTNGAEVAFKTTTQGYDVEVKIPFSLIGINNLPSIGQQIGIEFGVIDNDGAGTPDGKKGWYNTLDDSWQKPAGFGTAIFSENTATAISKYLSNESYKILIFPNPVNSNKELTVSLPEMENDTTVFSLFDMEGRTVLQTYGMRCCENTFRLGDIPKGTYLLKIKNNIINCSQIIIVN